MRVILLVVFMFIFGNSQAVTQVDIPPCLEKLERDARLSSIADHVALNGLDASTAMQGDQTKPGDAQKMAIADWIDARSECINQNPVKILIDLHLLFLSIVPELYNDQMTFGEFNRKWHTLFKEATEAAEATEKPQPAVHQH